MMIPILIAVAALIPAALYLWRQHKTTTPSLQWPVLANILELQYTANPPRISGIWRGRRVSVETSPAGATATAWLAVPTRLRVECGIKEIVTKRAGIVVPDPVEPVDRDFRDRLLARCSDKAAGSTVFDAALQQNLNQFAYVDVIGQNDRVTWTLPLIADPNHLENVLGALGALADALEHYPQGGTRA